MSHLDGLNIETSKQIVTTEAIAHSFHGSRPLLLSSLRMLQIEGQLLCF